MSGAESAEHKPDEVERNLRGPIRELREYARGRLDVDHQDVLPLAGLVEDDELRDVLIFLSQVYDPSEHEDLPASFWDTKLARMAIQKHATDAAATAVRQGDPNRAAYLTGVPSYRSDVSGLHAMRELADWLVHSEKCKLMYIAALMGRGKTDFALLLLESVIHEYERARRVIRESDDLDDGRAADVPIPEVAANFYFDPQGVASDVETAHIHSYPRLVEWVESGDVDQVRWFIFDEASTELTAQSGANSQRVAETVAPLVKKMRKNGVNMIVIGHDAGDVHPAIRELCDFIDKPSLKTADVYAGVSGREPVGHLFSVDGLPETSWNYNTDDMAEWSWTGEDVDDGDVDDGMIPVDEAEDLVEDQLDRYRNRRIREIYLRTDLSQSDVAEAFGLTQPTVSSIASGDAKFPDEYDPDDDTDLDAEPRVSVT